MRIDIPNRKIVKAVKDKVGANVVATVSIAVENELLKSPAFRERIVKRLVKDLEKETAKRVKASILKRLGVKK